jgi:preprotein translocase subunit SecE
LLARNKVNTENKKSTIYMKFVENIKESYNELVHKVSWPSRKELAQSSVIVLIASIILALIVWLMDYCFESIMTFVYGLF